MRDALKAQLEEAAELNQRSLSEEMEHQLEEQARLRDLIPALRRPGRLLQMAIFLQAIDSIEEETGKPWDEDEGLAGVVAARAVSAILDLKLNKAFDAHIATMANIGEPVRKFRSIPLMEPIPETEEPKLPAPERIRSGSPISKTSEASEPAGNDEDPLSPIERQMWERLKRGEAIGAHKLGMHESVFEEHARHLSEKLSALGWIKPFPPAADADVLGAKPRLEKSKKGQK
jgi:hypothetical protein